MAFLFRDLKGLLSCVLKNVMDLWNGFTSLGGGSLLLLRDCRDRKLFDWLCTGFFATALSFPLIGVMLIIYVLCFCNFFLFFFGSFLLLFDCTGEEDPY